MKYNFEGKKVLVTGAGQGLGRGVAVALHKSGADVYALSKTKSNLESLKQEINCSDRLTLINFDLNDLKNLQDVVKDQLPFHMLVNNAGINIAENLVDLSMENFDSVFDVNFKAPLLLTKQIAANMIENKIRGSIVNISSIASTMPLAQHCSYMVSKSALDALTKYSAWELGEHGIRVNSVNPTVVLTTLGKAHWSNPAKSVPMLNKIPLKKFAEIDDVVNAVLFLLSDDASMITGSCMPIDGGATI